MGTRSDYLLTRDCGGESLAYASQCVLHCAEGRGVNVMDQSRRIHYQFLATTRNRTHTRTHA